MNEPLYGMAVLRLAAAAGEWPLLSAPASRAERRSPTCGSRVTVDVLLDAEGRILKFGVEPRACALGQAAATLLARALIGRTGGDLARMSHDWARYLAGEAEALPDWPGIEALAAGRGYPARHASLRLPFEAAAEAAARAVPGGDDA